VTPEVFAELTPPYRTLVADPPWQYDNYATSPGRPGQRTGCSKRPLPYTSMTVAEISALPIPDLADSSGCWLFLWTTNRYLPQSFGVVDAWGFTYRQTLVWHKTSNPSPFGGSVAPNHAEFLLVASRGKPATTGRLQGSVIAAPKPYQHSRKPQVFLDAVEEVSPGPYVELFSRTPRLGWDSWGHGYEIGASA
jgi:N6-adenosine-specific RNA methylase IME4